MNREEFERRVHESPIALVLAHQGCAMMLRKTPREAASIHMEQVRRLSEVAGIEDDSTEVTKEFMLEVMESICPYFSDAMRAEILLLESGAA